MKLSDACSPPKSVTVHVTVVLPTGKELPLAGVHTGTRSSCSVSLAVTSKLTSAPRGPVALTTMVSGTAMVGASLVTMTVNSPLSCSPAKSVAVQDTMVFPMRKLLPFGGMHTGVSAGCSVSVTVAAKSTMAPVAPVAATVMFAGTVRSGAVLVIVTEKVACPVKPRESVAVHVTVLMPIGKTAPLAGVQVAVTGPSSGSVAETEKETVEPAPLAAGPTIGPGTFTTGAVQTPVSVMA
jgi:hypothetical protein